jgi:DNA polymerase-3 subunit epsilon
MWSCRWRRLGYRRRVRGTVLGACWDAPLPSMRAAWQYCGYLVCDAEMSSLAVAEGELLSLGWVAIEAGAIVLASAAHHLVAASRTVGQSAGIHQLRDCDLQGAEPESLVLERLCESARGRILVFHHAPLDLAYLDRASRRSFGAPLLLPTLDTLALERQRLERQGTLPPRGGLTLAACRRRYHLPDYPAHNALMDALATAELLLAIASHRGGVDRNGKLRPVRLSELV